VGLRIAAGRATAEDLDWIRGQLADPAYPFRRTYLIRALHDCGARDEALDSVVRQLQDDPAAEDTQLALGYLAEWAPERFTAVALPFLLGTNGASDSIRCWALAYAGGVPPTSASDELLDALARVAGDAHADEVVRKHAQRSIAEAAGAIATPQELVRFERREEELPGLLARARARRGAAARPGGPA
jgi:hypothetical protein